MDILKIESNITVKSLALVRSLNIMRGVIFSFMVNSLLTPLPLPIPIMPVKDGE